MRAIKEKIFAKLFVLGAMALPFLLGGVGGGVLFTSCGEFIELEENEGESASLKLNRNKIDLMVGDRFVVPAKLEPAELVKQGLYWLSGNGGIIDLKNDTLIAVSSGKTYVTATSVAGMVTDTCWVTVHPFWELSPMKYQYDMVVYAHVTANKHEMDDSIRVAAFAGDELRGVGQLRRHGETAYTMLRIYSESGESEKITLRCYDQRRAIVTDHATKLTFNGETMGTITSLYELAFP